MASKFIEPLGDTDFGMGLWTIEGGVPTIASDITHGDHPRSIRFPPGSGNKTLGARGTAADAGGRAVVWVYLVALPAATATLFGLCQAAFGTDVVKLKITTGGVCQLFNNTVQVGSNGSTLAVGQWYRICLSWNITSTTVNSIKTFINGATDITLSNVTLTVVTSNEIYVGNATGDTALDLRASDCYIDDSNAVTDLGNIYVTAKRPNANGTTNGFTAQIGSGGSGYGTGHSSQVNERPNSDTNGWSIVTVASAITEEYNIESKSQGDLDMTGATIIDYMGWVRTKALNAETAQIIINNVTSNISVTTSISFFTKIAASSTYPAGSGTDIGEISAASATTISLYECGIIFAYIPVVVKPGYKSLLGIGG